ncbi:hypothetical protein EG68_04781 [Paragonimus skrjabini miyazakii]|uniref:Tyrosine specific protein phosphatases domain-containing protein n=1 Tax=Paragonimus skrjabini miyazakii TaxID=59628 RepID=A0A8S9YXY9_9TREM|nr:hypothetical protein EG68_04781 [Paragonimus skrjabini miyazakii]
MFGLPATMVNFVFEKLDRKTIDDNKTSVKPRKSLKEKCLRVISRNQLCRLFCCGQRCKFCNPVKYLRGFEVAVQGLYSTWITENILAMSRPSTQIIKTYDIIQQFKKHNIKTVINMQSFGEHGECGDGNGACGFSYDPYIFMNNHIYFYNFAWSDHCVGSLTAILDAVDVMQFSLINGKVAVHCHAGVGCEGRTGTIIACYLIYNNRISATEAIRYVRQKRKILSVSLTTNKICRLQSSAPNFSGVNESVKGITDTIISPNALNESFSQNDDIKLLKPRFKNISPRVLKIVAALLTVTWSKDVNAEVLYWKKEFNTNPNALSKLENENIKQTVLSKLAFDWLKDLKNPVLRLQDLLALVQYPSKNIWEQLETLEKPVVCTFVLIARFLGCLKPLPAELELSLIRRFMELLLQLDDGTLSNNYSNNHLPTNSLDFSTGTFSELYAEAVNLMQTLTDSLPNSSGRKHCRISTSMLNKSES